jgi:hypothetical protein
VVLVGPSGAITVTRAYTYEAATTRDFNINTGAVLTTPSGVTITVPAQAVGPRAADTAIAGRTAITYTPIDHPAAPPGDVPLAFFAVDVTVNGGRVTTLTKPAKIELKVNTARVPAGQQVWLYEYVRTAVGDRWLLVPNQTYTAGSLTAYADRPGRYGLVTAAQQQRRFPIVLLP